MFFFHVAFSLGLVALTGGTALYIWSSRNEGPGTFLAKVIGLLVIIFALVSILCAVYCGLQFCKTYHSNHVMPVVSTDQQIKKNTHDDKE